MNSIKDGCAHFMLNCVAFTGSVRRFVQNFRRKTSMVLAVRKRGYRSFLEKERTERAALYITPGTALAVVRTYNQDGTLYMRSHL